MINSILAVIDGIENAAAPATTAPLPAVAVEGAGAL